MISTLFGIPLGLWVLAAVPETVVKAILAVVIIGFRLVLPGQPQSVPVERRPLGLGVRLRCGRPGRGVRDERPAAGGLRLASPLVRPNTSGPRLQGYFLPASLLGMGGYWLAGLWTPAVTRYYLWSLPLALAAIFLGRAINRRMTGRSFLRFVHVGLLVVGAVLLMQALTRF